MVYPKVIIAKTQDEIVEYLKAELETRAALAIEKNGRFFIGLSGGSLITYTSKALISLEIDFKLWKFFFCDERYVDENHIDSIYGTYKRSLLSQTTLKDEQFVHVNTSLNLDDCAQDYEEKLLKEFNLNKGDIPKFDLILLGMGPDGHICSLFENHPLLEEKHKLIAPIGDSPKQPPQRVTMTLPLLNNAAACLFVVTGKEKAKAVERTFQRLPEMSCPLPTQLLTISGQNWILDQASAANLSK